MTHAAPAAPPSLPADVAALRALVLATMAERDVLAEERDALATQNDRLRHLLVKLQRLQFGRKSERLPEEQLHLGLEDLETAIAEGEAKAEQRDPDLRRERTAKRRANRGALPAHLPRIEVVLEPQDTACPCCQKAMVVIGEDRSERLDVIPAQVRVLVTRRPKLACRALRRHRGADPRAAAADRGRPPHRGAGRTCAGLALRRPPAAVSPGADPGAAGGGARSRDAGVLGGLRGGRDRSGGAPAAGDRAGLGAGVRR